MIHRNQSYADYVAMEGVRVSALSAALKSRKQLWHAMTNETTPSRDMNVGTGVHAILTGHTDEIALWDGARRYGKEYDDWLSYRSPGQRVLIASEWEAATEIAYAVGHHPEASDLLSQCEYEVGLDHDGIKGRIDAIREEVLIDIKTTGDLLKFKWAWRNFHYGFKLESYRQLLLANDHQVDEVKLIIAENSPPYDVHVEPVPIAGVLEQWTERFEFAKQELKESLRTGEWPGVSARGEHLIDFSVDFHETSVDSVLDWSE